MTPEIDLDRFLFGQEDWYEHVKRAIEGGQQ
jgi:hypothetical protein